MQQRCTEEAVVRLVIIGTGCANQQTPKRKGRKYTRRCNLCNPSQTGPHQHPALDLAQGATPMVVWCGSVMVRERHNDTPPSCCSGVRSEMRLETPAKARRAPDH